MKVSIYLSIYLYELILNVEVVLGQYTYFKINI